MTAPASSPLTPSAEDYLKIIGYLNSKSQRATTGAVAELLHVKKPSVTAALHRLAGKGLVTYEPYAPARLTVSGRALANRAIHSYRTLHVFFTQVLGMPHERASQAACAAEHVFTPREIDAFDERLPQLQPLTSTLFASPQS